MKTSLLKTFVCALAGLLISMGQASAKESMTIHDIAGRDVTVEVPVQHLILGEGRLTYALAMLDHDNPFKRVVGWRDDLEKADPQGYDIYKARYPDIDQLPTFGGIKDGTFNVEQAITLDPDVIVMNIEAKGATDEAGLEQKLAQVGIPIVYVDFREAPMEHTDDSMRILGQLTGESDRAEAFINFRAAHLKTIHDRLAEANPKQPDVFLERAAGYSDACCMSFGPHNFGAMLKFAGGHNIAENLIPGAFGNVNPEQIIAANPDQVIATGGSWSAYAPNANWIPIGPTLDKDVAREKLAELMKRPAFTEVKAVQDHQVHAIWHQFYNSPYQFIAIEQMAKWLHPQLFNDIDPEQTFRELHERFLPIDYHSGYFVSLRP